MPIRRELHPKNRHLAKRIKRARESAELSRDQVDERLGRPSGFCAAWEENTRAIDPHSLNAFAKLVRVPPDWFFTGRRLSEIHPPVGNVQDAIASAQAKVPGGNKKNWSEAFSRALAILFANELRADFSGITPDEHGRRQERRARTNRGYKKLDVGYSTEDLGLALGVSIKSINFKDPRTGRYTKNYSRNDNELRAEAMDYHRRQPFAVLVGILMLPIDSCDDGGGAGGEPSSFAAAVRYFRQRTGRIPPSGDADLFESFFIGLYDSDAPAGENDIFFDVTRPPPKTGRPVDGLLISDVAMRIKQKYDEINTIPFSFAP
jgi:transcriptional regulator with XRE-family HTH domain